MPANAPRLDGPQSDPLDGRHPITERSVHTEADRACSRRRLSVVADLFGIEEDPIHRRYADPGAPGDLGALQAFSIERSRCAGAETCSENISSQPAAWRSRIWASSPGLLITGRDPRVAHQDARHRRSPPIT